MKQDVSESASMLDGETFSRASGEADKMATIERHGSFDALVIWNLESAVDLARNPPREDNNRGAG